MVGWSLQQSGRSLRETKGRQRVRSAAADAGIGARLVLAAAPTGSPGPKISGSSVSPRRGLEHLDALTTVSKWSCVRTRRRAPRPSGTLSVWHGALQPPLSSADGHRKIGLTKDGIETLRHGAHSHRNDVLYDADHSARPRLP